MSFKTGRLSLKMKSNFFSHNKAPSQSEKLTPVFISRQKHNFVEFLWSKTISSRSSWTAFRQFGWVGRESCHGVAFAGSKPNDSKIPKRSNENSDPKPKKIGAPPLLSFSALVSQCRPVATCQNYHILLTWEKAILYFFQNRWPFM